MTDDGRPEFASSASGVHLAKPFAAKPKRSTWLRMESLRLGYCSLREAARMVLVLEAWPEKCSKYCLVVLLAATLDVLHPVNEPAVL